MDILFFSSEWTLSISNKDGAEVCMAQPEDISNVVKKIKFVS